MLGETPRERRTAQMVLLLTTMLRMGYGWMVVVPVWTGAWAAGPPAAGSAAGGRPGGSATAAGGRARPGVRPRQRGV